MPCQCMAELKGGQQRAVWLVLVRALRTEDDFHDTSFVVDSKAVDAPLQRVHDLLYCQYCFMNPLAIKF